MGIASFSRYWCYLFQVFAGDVGYGDGEDVFYGDDDGEVFLDALEGAFDSCKHAVGYADFLAWLAGESEIFEHYDVFVVAVYDADEVLHLLVGDVGYGADGVVVLVAPDVHDVAQVVVFGFVGLELAQVPECGAKEDVVDECGGVGVFVGVDKVLWYVGLDNGFFVAEETVELALAFDAGVEYAHGVPAQGVFGCLEDIPWGLRIG